MKREVKKFRDCGDLKKGYRLFVCEGCHDVKKVAFRCKKIGLKCIKYISTVTKIKESIICGAQIVSANPFLFKTAVKTNTN